MIHHINAALGFIARCQADNGGFVSWSGDRRFSRPRSHKTVFIACLIGRALRGINHPEAQTIGEKIGDFLLAERGEHWTWNYWQRETGEYHRRSYPDDLDDTAQALYVLRGYRPDVLDAAVWAAVTKNLIAVELQLGGPYNTWLIDYATQPAWRDSDPAVNAAVGELLATEDIHLPPLAEYLEKLIARRSFASRYYDPLMVCSAMARSYRGAQTAELADIIKRFLTLPRYRGSLVHTALAVSALLSLGEPRTTVAALICRLQTAAEQTLWRVEPVYIEKSGPYPTYAGSAALTAACVAEALVRYGEGSAPRSPQSLHSSHKNPFPNRHRTILVSVLQRLSCLPAHTRKCARTVTEKLLSASFGPHITLLPSYSNAAFKTDISEAALEKMGCANAFGWIAQAMYDDIRDDNTHSALLPAAALCLRETVSLYAELVPGGQCAVFHGLMDDMDQTAAQEQENRLESCRPIRLAAIRRFNEKNGAKKSLPHAFAALAPLAYRGIAPTDPRYNNLLQFFINYLAARQLNDDAHDWLSDLDAGLLTSVGAEVLLAYYYHRGRPAEVWLTERVRDELQYLFWSQVMTLICGRIHKLTAAAKQHMERLEPLHDTEYFMSLLHPLEQAAQTALAQQAEAAAFLAAFKQSRP